MERNEFFKKVGFGLFTTQLILGCKKNDDEVDPETTDGTETGTGECIKTASETDGPYPLYNSRGSSISRVDVRDGKAGLPLYMTLTITNLNNSCAVLANATVDIWHCDKDGYYSGYSNQGYLGTQNNTSSVFLRGRQTTDSNGQVKFTSIYPGWYTGRLTHIHVQIYSGTKLLLTTQIAFPDAINQAVYTTDLYKAHGQNTMTLAQDNVFNDGTTGEMATVTTNAGGGYDLVHTINVSA